MQTPEKKAPEPCRPYDDDNCAGCEYDGMFGCISARAADERSKDVSERTESDLMFPFRNRAR